MMDYFNAYTVAGAFTGFIVGLTGVGGGAIMTPILLIFFGINPASAVATDLWFATITKIAALAAHQRARQVDWFVVKRLWCGSLPTATLLILALLSHHLVNLHASTLPFLIGAVIFLTAIGMMISPLLQKRAGRFNESKAIWFKAFQSPVTILAGAILGCLVTLTSVGAGALGSMMLLYIYPTRLTTNKLVGTDIAHAIPLAFIAGLGYLIGGHVNGHLLLSLLVGSLPAAFLGSHVATRLPHKKLRFCLAAMLSISGIKLMGI